MEEEYKKRKIRSGVKNIRSGLYWWFIRILPFLIIYFLVKITFFMGYFDVFGGYEIQLMAHDFFVKILVTICIFVTFVAFKRYFLDLIKGVFYSLIDRYFRSEEKEHEIVDIFSNIILYTVFFFVILMVLNLWFSTQIKWFTELFTSTSILIFSFVAGLFTSSILGNILAFEILRRLKEFKIGNRVKIGDVYGDIQSMGLFFTHIKTINNEVINIPNLLILTKGVKNYSGLKEVIISVSISLPYVVSVDKAKEFLLESALKTKDIIKTKDKKPVVWCEELEEYSVKYQVRVFIEDPKNREQVKSELIGNILKEAEKRKIKMPLPRRMTYEKKK